MTTSSNIFETIADPTAGVDLPPGRAVRLRHLVTAGCLPLLFVLMAVGAFVDPLDDDADSATTLARAAGHTGAVAALSWLELVGAVVTVAGLLGLVGVLRRRGSGWANAVGTAGVLLAVGEAVIAANHWLVVALIRAEVPTDTAVRTLDAFHSAGGPVAVLFFLPPVTYLLAAVAAWRAGLVPAAGLVLGVLFVLVFSVPGEVGQLVAYAVGLALTGWIALGVLTRSSGRAGSSRALAQ